jgi:hypothetical protein
MVHIFRKSDFPDLPENTVNVEYFDILALMLELVGALAWYYVQGQRILRDAAEQQGVRRN